MMDEQIQSGAPPRLATTFVLGMRVDSVEFNDSAKLIARWAAQVNQTRARIVCAANVHMVMEAWDDASYRATINRADLVLADGQPLVWALRLLNVPQRRRVRVSPDLLLCLFAEAERGGWSIGLYGGRSETLPAFTAFVAERFPRLNVGFAFAPPFRPLTAEEDKEVVERVRAAGVRLLLVGLGCPKQERWMAEHTHRLSCVMIGVGAAFDLFGGRTKEAPRWTRNIGLEWAYRLIQEPRRLWRRHARHDPRFLALLAQQVMQRR